MVLPLIALPASGAALAAVGGLINSKALLYLGLIVLVLPFITFISIPWYAWAVVILLMLYLAIKK